MNPPLREEADRQAIIEGLQDNTIDMIATDHAPHTAREKEKPLTEAPSGIIGLETSLSLGIMNLVDTGKLTLLQLLERMSPGAPPGFIIWMPDIWQKEALRISFFLMRRSCGRRSIFARNPPIRRSRDGK